MNRLGYCQLLPKKHPAFLPRETVLLTHRKLLPAHLLYCPADHLQSQHPQCLQIHRPAFPVDSLLCCYLKNLPPKSPSLLNHPDCCQLIPPLLSLKNPFLLCLQMISLPALPPHRKTKQVPPHKLRPGWCRRSGRLSWQVSL